MCTLRMDDSNFLGTHNHNYNLFYPYPFCDSGYDCSQTLNFMLMCFFCYIWIVVYSVIDHAIKYDNQPPARSTCFVVLTYGCKLVYIPLTFLLNVIQWVKLFRPRIYSFIFILLTNHSLLYYKIYYDEQDYKVKKTRLVVPYLVYLLILFILQEKKEPKKSICILQGPMRILQRI